MPDRLGDMAPHGGAWKYRGPQGADGALSASVAALLAEQAERGAFPSHVAAGDRSIADETCFVTAQVALLMTELIEKGEGRGLLAGPDCRALRRARARALDFIETCAAPDLAGAFHFYPPENEDGEEGGGDPPFLRPALYRTWFVAPGEDSPVDLIVNINILACLAAAGCDPVKSAPAARAVVAACRECDLSRSALRAFAPYYADPCELEIALARALDLGAEALRPAHAQVAAHGDDARDRNAGRPRQRALYCNAHGRPIWRAPALQAARHCRDRLLALAEIPVFPSSSPGGSHDDDAKVCSR
ncbi:hypothetical protein H1W37_06410 [Stappia taiwanensis]|uniref:Uncharacterized protein n=1 Tax=Stappia taiwanensis TaxID=992267 RepID=A0A838XW43_9HYPH|nr:hypothetical protein [Stappia taiwanensis]MBA4611274.1 hypothetical protein [Stappia taiwanensis]GGE87292.1 hypothetical protein GCM10007285_13660 [Stappia taiwanensis]